MLEIKKLEDVVVWADNQIQEMRIDLVPSLGEEEFEKLGQVEEFETVKKVVNEAIKRHAAYIQALKNDFANKAAEVDELRKEIEGRKSRINDGRQEEVKKLNKCIMEKNETINAANDAIVNLCKEIGDKNEEIEELKKKNMDDFRRRDDYMTNQAKCICELEKKIKNQKENLEGLNKTLEIRTKEKESLINVKNSQEKEIEAHEEENKRLTEKIMELKKERDKHMARVNDLRMELDCVKASKEKHEEAAHEKVVEDLRENITYLRNKYVAAQDEIDKLNGTIEELKKEDDHGRAGFEEYIKYIISEEEGKFKEELNKRFSEEVSKISMQRTEEELAKAKLNEFKEGIPCGEDAIE